jgi:hypothetical protein
MRLRHLTRILTLAAAATLVASTNGVSQDAPAARIVAIADIHGAGDALVGILQAAGLVDSGQHWSGGKSIFVQTGDYLDRGADVRRIMDLLMALEDEARKAGGRAEILMGNHEAMNILREPRDVSPAALATFADDKSEDRRGKAYDDYVSVAKRSGAAELQVTRDQWMAAHPPGFIEYMEALGPRGKYGRWLRNRKVILKLDDTIFMHAGLSPETNGSIDDVNRDVARVIQAWDETTEMMTKQGVILPFFTLKETIAVAGGELQRIAEALKQGREPGNDVTTEYVNHLDDVTRIGASPLLAANGPLWFRGLSQQPSSNDAEVAAIAQKFGAKRFVVGHTPQLPKGRIAAQFGGLVYPIDTGMLSTFFKGGRASALELQGTRITAIYTNEREVLSEGKQ